MTHPVRSIAALAGAAAAGLIVWALSVHLAGVDLTVGTGPPARTVGPLSVVVAALVAGGAGWALLAFMQRRSAHGRRTWRIVATVVLVLSLLGPWVSGATGAVLVTLIAMHVVVGVTAILGLAAPTNRHAGE